MGGGHIMKYTLVFLVTFGAWAGASCVWAHPEASDAPTHTAAADKPAERAMPRTPLWQAVEALYRQRALEPLGDDRRLTQDQRHELREQIRRGAVPTGAEVSDRSTGVQPALR